MVATINSCLYVVFRNFLPTSMLACLNWDEVIFKVSLRTAVTGPYCRYIATGLACWNHSSLSYWSWQDLYPNQFCCVYQEIHWNCLTQCAKASLTSNKLWNVPHHLHCKCMKKRSVNGHYKPEHLHLTVVSRQSLKMVNVPFNRQFQPKEENAFSVTFCFHCYILLVISGDFTPHPKK